MSRPAPAALLLHGFTGDPWEVAPLVAPLAAAGFRVEAPRLPGHDGRPESLAAATWRDWHAAARQALTALAA
ncbi:MAG TPA: alpha/beta fold hydrolase, partial [Thermodesulfobacteriota bacterium]|nr:alpha/beta fold hydrolase [Thermodesulfobacteriota bacterium]